MTTVTPTELKVSLGSLMAKYVGQLSNWVNRLPSRESAQAAFDLLPPELQARIASRAAKHGMEAVDLMQRAPQELWDNPEAFDAFLNMMDVSHIKSISTNPELADDPSNVIWEVSGTNRARGAAEMTGAEYSDATGNARDVARDLTDSQIWWDLNDVFKGALGVASTLGYSLAWLPKPAWKEMMEIMQDDLPEIDTESTFSGKYVKARAFAKKIRMFFKKHKHQVAAAFMLGVLTLFWPPAAFFMAAWALTGVLGVATHLLRSQLNRARNRRNLIKLLDQLDVTLEHFETIMDRCRSFLDAIKTGIFKITTKGVDLFFGLVGELIKIVQPHVERIIKKAKVALDGFIGWLGSVINNRQPAFA